jgi:hypothetical protein
MQGRRQRRGVRGGLIALLAVLAAGSVAQAVEAREVQTSRASDDDTDLMQAFTAARADMDAGRWARAAAGFRQVTAQATGLFGADNEKVLIVRSWLALALMNSQAQTEAFHEAHAVEVAGLPTLGAEHEATDRVSLVLAVEDMTRGDMEAARRRLQASYDWNRAQGDTETAATIAVILGQVLHALGRGTEADSLAVRGQASDGVMTDVGAIRSARLSGDDAAVIEAAESLMRRPQTPEAMRVLAAIERGGALSRTGRGDEAVASLRTLLAKARKDGAPLDRMALEDGLAGVLAPLDTDDRDLSKRDPAVVDEALALWHEALAGSIEVLGADHPTTLRRRGDYVIRLISAGQPEQALIEANALAAADDAAPGRLSQDRRALAEASRATALLQLGQVRAGYEGLKAAAGQYQAFALSAPHRDEARALIASRSSLFRNQVLLGWVLSGQSAEGTRMGSP